jgi:hypothetical protein
VSVYYSEKSKLHKPWMFLMTLPVIILFSVLAVTQFRDGELVNAYLSVFFLVFTVAILIFIATHRMTLWLDSEGVHFKYFPYQIKERTITWKEIEDIDTVEYDPIHDFGGWGYKRSKVYGQGYTTEGVLGLRIKLKDGTRLFLTISDQQKVAKSLENRSR